MTPAHVSSDNDEARETYEYRGLSSVQPVASVVPTADSAGILRSVRLDGMEVRPPPSRPDAVRSSISPPPLRHVLSVFFLPFRTVQMRTNVPHRHIYTYNI
ncbi:hypothetical protein Hanom_Chr16g01440501 [Helianthus anomalus]